ERGRGMVGKSMVLLTAAAFVAGCSALPERSSDRPPERRARGSASVGAMPAPYNPATGQCLAELGRSGAEYTALPDRYFDQGCTITSTVQLAALASNRSKLEVTNVGPVTCSVSQAFSGWALYGVERAARQILGSPVRSIETMGSYSCRNVAGSGRRSAHA